MEKERKITAPGGCEIEKVELVDGVAVVTFRKKKRQLPKSWEEFYEMTGVKIPYNLEQRILDVVGDRPTADAVLALCQIIQLRNCYNGDWVPDWTDDESKFTIDFIEAEIYAGEVRGCCTPLYFETKDIRDEFLRYFRPMVEKLKPLYGIKKGGEE